MEDSFLRVVPVFLGLKRREETILRPDSTDKQKFHLPRLTLV